MRAIAYKKFVIRLIDGFKSTVRHVLCEFDTLTKLFRHVKVYVEYVLNLNLYVRNL